MDFGNALVEALRRRTATRVYGTPFYATELAKRAQQVQGGDLANQLAQLQLQQEPQKFQSEMDTAAALRGSRAATTGLTTERIQTEAAKNDPERLALEDHLKQARTLALTAKTPIEQARAAAYIADIEDKIRKRPVGGAARPGQGMQVVTDPQGNVILVDKAAGTSKPVMAPGSTEPLKKQPPAGEMEKRGNIESMLSDVQRLKELSSGEAGKSVGPAYGRLVGATRGTLNYSSDVNDLFHISDNLADQLLRARSGAQINESEFKRLRELVPNPRTVKSKFDADLRRFEIELQNALSARKGGPTSQSLGGNTTGAPPPKSKYKLISVE